VIALHPLQTIDEVLPGDDLPRMLAEAINATGLTPNRCDVLVVTQKIVSKQEDRFIDLASVTPSLTAIELANVTLKDPRFVEIVLTESTEIVRAAPNVLITRHRSGHVMANAGVDRSNLGPGSAERVLLLPVDADTSADSLRSALMKYWSEVPAVVISDSFGRPWRYGVTNVAIGVSGLPALIDRRGEKDRNDRRLEVTQVAYADLIAAAAGLATGEGAEGVPAALVRGLLWNAQDCAASSLVRPLEEDLFR